MSACSVNVLEKSHTAQPPPPTSRIVVNTSPSRESYVFFRRLITWWALGGGVVLLAVVLVNVVSVVGAAVVNKPFPGDFELTQMGVCIAAFAFLPYCQLTGSNVSADIFTSGLSQRAIVRLGVIGAVIALLFAGLLMWRMYAGMLDQKTYDYTTAILQIPHWWAFLPILASLALLAIAALISVLSRHG